MKEEEKIVLIERYVNGAFTPEELVSFKDKMSQDASFAEEVKMYLKLSAHFNNETLRNIEPKDHMDFRNYLNSRDAQEVRKKIIIGETLYKDQSKETLINKVPWFKIAATLLIIFSLGALFFNERGEAPQELYVTYYSQEDLPSLVQRDEYTTTLDKGLSHFKNKEYESALLAFSNYRRESRNYNPVALLYEGITLIELNRLEEANQKLNAFIALETIENVRAYWFKGLIALKQDNPQEALRLFKKLQNNAANYKVAEVEAILQALK